MPQNVPSFDELLNSAQHSAVHLEMRDAYGVAAEADDFARWKSTGERDTDPASSYWAPWVTLIRSTVARGVVVRRARIVSEPVSDYIRYEHAGTVVNVEAGERVRWLPRRRASDIALPGNDFWLIDDRLIRWNHFTGDGASGGGEISEDPAAAELCADAFEAVWARATPHEDYKIS
ncbi:hypothetical protein Sipo8835_22735 [Streptomyces ipomoeae]|jgi:hypothetical protein|uniref:DUF6879 domain-containing protein n=2 Tax=Streptomyces ipomoeae TaxID=103232 RepID=L1L1M4_9ACTN|nr:DUF6879 family protein [Streptomyces ipomoeae]EKX66600.1 hypothetical protein STRIP9103_04078 [Streptomyces ipomoeae 91-03]MDX2697189.1 hypothetical protein [Streptomyces ipomoeae]MDX2824742.1 hypothetical protein [Streptomyces ipomoeae]MDX2843037.1 hypothetical protein [Streptomyces ipomoeae]MDX2877395.1 hypothetical protein [Streptomyces ipomoeae]